MMRSRRPWWALLTAATLVLASMLAPTEGAAYRVVGLEPGGAAKGDPDDTTPSKPQLSSQGAIIQGTVMVLLEPIPGVSLRVWVPARLFSPSKFSKRSQR